jgi:peroxidase
MSVSRSTALAAALLLTSLPAFAAGAPNTRTLPKGPFRAVDGTGNNTAHPTWGAAPTLLIQNVPMSYGDSISSMGGASRPNARLISNVVVAQPNVPPHAYASNYLWMWGQFMDHDLDLTLPQTLSAAPFCTEEADIPVPAGDSTFDPNNTGTAVIVFCRNGFDTTTGTDTHHQRVQTNVITSFVDASNVYASDPSRAKDLRKLDGSGELRSVDGPGHEQYLPRNVNGQPNPIPGPDRHLCGDPRCEENTNLFSIHTLWMREHNYWARKIRTESARPLTDEEIFQRARMIVGAEIEAITYNEFLPVLIGPGAIPPYTGYKANVNPGISTVFSTASYRMGHTLLTHVLNRLGPDLQPIPGGDLTLQQSFFSPEKVISSGGIEPFLRGAAHQHANAFDSFIVDDVRNFLVNDPQPGSFDLAALNIQRGRDHGLPDYNGVRVAYGLAPKATIADVNPGNPEITRRLSAAYTNVNDIDPWVGGVSEAPFPGAVVGELVRTVIAEQFTRSRDGDRFFYLNTFPANWKNYFNNLHLSDVILRNTTIGKKEIQQNLFLAQ